MVTARGRFGHNKEENNINLNCYGYMIRMEENNKELKKLKKG